MLSRMTWYQFVGWMRYASVEPFGEERADARMAVGWSIIANVHRDRKKRPRPFRPKDFMLFVNDRPAQSEYAPIKDQGKFRQMTNAMRAAFGRKKRREA